MTKVSKYFIEMGQSGRALRVSRDEREGGEDVKRQVDSDVNHQRPIYQLANVKTGGGKLIDIIKSRAKDSGSSFALSKSVDLLSNQHQAEESIDKQIRDLVEPLLYNEGRGKLLPLSRIWRYRLDRAKGKLSDDETEVGENSGLPNVAGVNHDAIRYRWVCWKLEERGFVGETALHICFLLSTPSHMILAKKLLIMFPMLINDTYFCDEYFGESSLHMAIVNEDIKIVKLLLDHGANVHERCLGSFFLPNDLKDKANNSIRRIFERANEADYVKEKTIESELEQIDLQSNHFSTLETNYDGHAYWGEYPLSFAASLGLGDCYRLLLAKGADPNRQDSNGNSTLHMAVIADRIDMFDLCYSNGADLELVNKLNLSPLTLAAKLRRVDMFFHILTIQRQVNWVFCNVGFVETPLSGIDSIDTNDGSCDDDSVLSIVVSGVSIATGPRLLWRALSSSRPN